MSKIDDLTYNQLNSSNTIYASLNNLLKNGIEIDKNLRQPTYYSRISLDELKIEIFAIINNFLINQKVPLWLCQRISWFYSNKYMNEIVKHFKELENNNDDNQELKFIKREKLVDFIKNHISKIIAEWFTEKANQNDPKNMLFSFSRFEAKHLKTILHYSEFGLKNKRRIMEDKTAIFENIDLFCNNKEISFKKRSNSLFGVFDGHCGADCSQYISTHLPMHLIQHEDFFNSNNNKDMSKLLKESFQIINERFTEKAKLESLKSGSTCCLALLNSLETNNINNNNNDNKTSQMRSIDVAWCGDTQFCLIRNGQIYFITDEHKPNQPNELKRIEESGSTVTFTSEAWRINGSLAVSRSFGDVNYQPSVIAEPDVKHIDLDEAFDYFIIGCDGLWETFNKNDLLEFVYEHRNDVNVNMAELLVRKALENGSTDNITAIFVLLKDDLSQIEKPIIL